MIFYKKLPIHHRGNAERNRGHAGGRSKGVKKKEAPSSGRSGAPTAILFKTARAARW
jgi:hypothetical protein